MNFQEAKTNLEKEIGECVAERLSDFKARTGANAKDVNISLGSITIEEMGAESYLVSLPMKVEVTF